MTPFDSIKVRFHRWQFQRAVQGVLQTPQVVLAASGYTALSMVHHRDVLPYLLAIKSIAHHLPPAAVVVVADPTLDAQDRQIIATHVPGVRFLEAVDARVDGVPTGGCWERLLSIAQECQRSYVVQIDADLVAVGALDEVRAAIQRSVCFTLGTMDDQAITSTQEAAARWQNELGDASHVQALAESLLERFDPTGEFRYVRGCAGFAGFARGSITIDRVRSLSARMGGVMGDRWSEWGTEQFASNLLVASSPGAMVLPHPKYCAPHYRRPASALFHFIGFVRFRDGFYAATARRLISTALAGEAR